MRIIWRIISAIAATVIIAACSSNSQSSATSSPLIPGYNRPPELRLAWSWIIKNRAPLLNSSRNPWHFLPPDVSPSGDISYMSSYHKPAPLLSNVIEIVSCLNNEPFGISKYSPSPEKLSLFSIRGGNPIGKPILQPNDIVDANGKRFARLIDNINTADQSNQESIYIGDVMTNTTHLITTLPQHSQRQVNKLLCWGTINIYGTTKVDSNTDETTSRALWWIDNTKPSAPRHELWYGPHEQIDQVTFSAATDQIAYVYQPDNTTNASSALAKLQIQNAVSGNKKTIDTGISFSHLAFSPDGRYLVALYRNNPTSTNYDLRLYDLEANTPPIALYHNIMPWQVLWHGQSLSGDIYRWDREGTIFLVLTGATIHLTEEGTIDGMDVARHAHIFKLDTAERIDTLDLPQNTASIEIGRPIENRIGLITYQDDGTALFQTYYLGIKQYAEPFALGKVIAKLICVQ